VHVQKQRFPCEDAPTAAFWHFTDQQTGNAQSTVHQGAAAAFMFAMQIGKLISSFPGFFRSVPGTDTLMRLKDSSLAVGLMKNCYHYHYC
jgi:hypothetical protein